MVNTDKIERDAVNAVRMSIDSTDSLISDINDTDKYPSWDGSVRIYKDDSNKTEDLLGKVDVQVKGKSMDELPEDINFPVRTCDLNNYFKGFGAIYFVVGISNDTKQIYYLELLPFKISQILKNGSKQEHFSLKFKRFPDNNIEKITIFRDFLRDQRMQAKIVENKAIDLKALEDKGLINSYTIPISILKMDLENNDPYRYAFEHPGFVYANTDFGNFPIKEIGEISSFQENHPHENVKIGNVLYYKGYRANYYKDYHEIEINENVSLRFEKTKQILYQIKGCGSLSEQLHNLKFGLALTTENILRLGQQEFINNKPDAKNIESIKELEDKLAKLKNLYQVTELLQITNQFNVPLENLSEDDWKALNLLRSGLINNRPVIPPNNSPKKQYIFADIKVADLYLLVRIFMKDGMYYIQDLYSEILPASVVASDGTEHLVSPFLFLSEKHFEYFCNLNYSVIVKDLQKHIKQPLYVHELTNVLLIMLLAYDKQKDKKTELLEAAIFLAKKMYKNDCSHNVNFLNYIQALKRKRSLFKNEKNLLKQVLSNKEITIVEQLGAAILLEDFEQANILYQQLSKSDQKNFDTLPINKLWINRGNENVQQME